MKKRIGKPDGNGKAEMNLLVAMTGKASSAKAAEGDKPVFDYIASLPQPQRGIAERIDALAAKILPNLRRALKWGMAYYGVGCSPTKVVRHVWPLILPSPISIRRERETSRGHRRRLNDRCCGLPVSQEFVQNGIKVWNFFQEHFKNEAVFTRDTVALGNFGNRLC